MEKNIYCYSENLNPKNIMDGLVRVFKYSFLFFNP